MDNGIEQKVRTLFDSVLTNENYFKEIDALQKILGITRKQIEAAWLYWDTAIQKYSNEVYTSDSLRFAMHLHNYLEGSWHEKRQVIILNYLETINPHAICEIGFGVPQKYVHKFLSDERKKIVLADFEDTSIKFAKSILSLWSIEWKERAILLLFDMNKDNIPPKQDVYIFQDSIEHAVNPTEILSKFVSSANTGAHFLFSLPIEIENPIPEHHICWKDHEEVIQWLKDCGLEVLRYEKIPMNRNIDIFAQSLHPDFCEIVILAKK